MGSISADEREARARLAKCRSVQERRDALKRLAEAQGLTTPRQPERYVRRTYNPYRRW